jgi:hypothetical protein
MMAAYQVLLLNTAIPQIQAAQSGDTYVVPRDIAINATAIISANSATDALRITQIGAGNAILVEDSANPDSTPFVVTGAGDVGIGTSSPDFKLVVAGNTDTRIRVDGSSSAGIYFTQGGSNAGTIRGKTTGLTFFVPSAGQAMDIDTSGNLLVGTTDSSQGSGNGNKLLAGGAVYVVNAATSDGFSYYNSSASAYRFYVSSGGTISATNTTISAISDIRFKENIRDLNVGLAEIMALRPRLYDWKEGKGADIKNARGFIAQEFEEVFPDLIDEWKDPAPEGEEPYKSVRADLIPVLVKALQEQQSLITSLTERISALEAK